MKRTLEYGLHDFFTVIFLWFLGILSVAGCVIIGRVIIDRVVIRHFIFVLRWFIQRPHLFNSLIKDVVNIINKINITFNLLYPLYFIPQDYPIIIMTLLVILIKLSWIIL